MDNFENNPNMNEKNLGKIPQNFITPSSLENLNYSYLNNRIGHSDSYFEDM